MENDLPRRQGEQLKIQNILSFSMSFLRKQES
jgi:hypothetical protein